MGPLLPEQMLNSWKQQKNPTTELNRAFKNHLLYCFKLLV